LPMTVRPSVSVNLRCLELEALRQGRWRVTSNNSGNTFATFAVK
jgi:hypothetical protein